MDSQVQIRSWSSGKQIRPEIDCSIVSTVWLVTDAMDEIIHGVYVCGKNSREPRMEAGETLMFKGGLSW